MSPVNSLPAIPDTALPADVRNGTEKDKQAYQAALGFERVMLGTLTKQLTEGSELADGPYASVVQDAFSGSLVANGGLGLGEQLFRTFTQSTSSTGTSKERA
jgi:Rod binding domain-containing protein